MYVQRIFRDNRFAFRPGVNFINILFEPFCTKGLCTAFLYLQFGFVIFWPKNIGAKATPKMLIKLTTGSWQD